MLYVVDGYNAVRRVARLRDVEARDGLEAGRDALIAALLAKGLPRGDRIVVVFDGGGLGDGGVGVSQTARVRHPRLDVRFSRAPQDADAAIVAFVEKARAKEHVAVVTADRELAFAVERLGATVTSPETWERLRATAPPRTSRPAARSDKPDATKADVLYWLDVFGEDE